MSAPAFDATTTRFASLLEVVQPVHARLTTLVAHSVQEERPGAVAARRAGADPPAAEASKASVEGPDRAVDGSRDDHAPSMRADLNR